MSSAESLVVVKQVGAAVFYGASSLLIIMVNKAVLTSYKLVTARCKVMDTTLYSTLY